MRFVASRWDSNPHLPRVRRSNPVLHHVQPRRLAPRFLAQANLPAEREVLLARRLVPWLRRESPTDQRFAPANSRREELSSRAAEQQPRIVYRRCNSPPRHPGFFLRRESTARAFSFRCPATELLSSFGHRSESNPRPSACRADPRLHCAANSSVFLPPYFTTFLLLAQAHP